MTRSRRVLLRWEPLLWEDAHSLESPRTMTIYLHGSLKERKGPLKERRGFSIRDLSLHLLFFLGQDQTPSGTRVFLYSITMQYHSIESPSYFSGGRSGCSLSFGINQLIKICKSPMIQQGAETNHMSFFLMQEYHRKHRCHFQGAQHHSGVY